MSRKKHIVVIGGGFSGLNFAKRIDKKLFDVTVIDRNNYHSFPPLFYQVAAGSLEPASISFPFRRELRGSRMEGCRFIMGNISRVDTKAKTVSTDEGMVISYDRLVIAAGSTNNFFGIDHLHEHVYTIKSTSEAIRCRNGILSCLEHAANVTDPDERRRQLTFVVIGGGPAGVEIAGALGELKSFVIAREYPALNPDDVKVILFEGSDRLLKTMTEKSSADALEALTKLNVDVRLGMTMKTYDGTTATFADGHGIEAKTLIWTAGVTAISFDFSGIDPATGPGNRLVVDPYNRVKGLDCVYAIGDICIHTDTKYPHGCPQLAQVAIQQGVRLADNLNRRHDFTPFEYNDKGTMATIGRNKAVVDLRHIHFKGWPAWMTWMIVHLISLLGMRNRIIVLLNWTWSYFKHSSALRLILRPSCMPADENICDRSTNATKQQNG